MGWTEKDPPSSRSRSCKHKIYFSFFFNRRSASCCQKKKADCLPAALLRFKPWYKGFMRGAYWTQLLSKKNVARWFLVEVVGAMFELFAAWRDTMARVHSLLSKRNIFALTQYSFLIPCLFYYMYTGCVWAAIQHSCHRCLYNWHYQYWIWNDVLWNASPTIQAGLLEVIAL